MKSMTSYNIYIYTIFVCVIYICTLCAHAHHNCSLPLLGRPCCCRVPGGVGRRTWPTIAGPPTRGRAARASRTVSQSSLTM